MIIINNHPKIKKFFISVFILIIFSILVVGLFIDRRDDSITTPSSLTKSTTNTKNRFPSANYLFNKIETKSNITAYGWRGDRLYYSTKEGIYEAGVNKKLVNKNIEDIYFSKKGFAIYKSDNKWQIFDPDTRKTKNTIIAGTSAKINSSASYVVSFGNKILEVVDINFSSKKTLETKSEIKSLFIPKNKNIFVIQSQNITANNILIYNFDFENLFSLEIPENSVLLGISDNAKYVAFSQPGKVLIKSIKSQKEISVDFESNSKISGNWIDNNYFIVIETSKDKYKRITDYIFLVKIDGSKTLLSTSIPIPNKLNTNIATYKNLSNTVLAFSENNGPIWLLSLVSNQIMGYNTSGLQYYNIADFERNNIKKSKP